METKVNNIKAAEFRGMMIERTDSILRWMGNLSKKMEKLQDEQISHGESIERLKIKAGFWGFLAGAIPALVTALIMLLR